MNDLRKHAVLVRLSIGQMTTTRKDRDATDEVTTSKRATENAARVNKSLFPNNKRLKAITAIANEARAAVAGASLPWMPGVGILKVSGFERLSSRINRLKEAFEAEVEEFVREYDEAVEQARAALGELFNPEDYPTAEQARKKFRFNFSVMPLPDTSDWRLNVDPDLMQRIREDAEAEVLRQTSDAMADAFERIRKAVSAMHERLSNPEAIFRDSLVGNIRELCDVLPSLNLLDDPRLNKLVDDMRQQLAAHEPQELRDDPALRQSVADAAALTLRSLSDVLADEDDA